jgi:prepilin-type N-terminal cleavage/methylation domain-containing protein
MRRAFTLIELLVVIAIIAILAAILFPVFAQAKEAAKKAAHISNNKQVGTATQIYLGDTDDVYPLAQTTRPLGVNTWFPGVHPSPANVVLQTPWDTQPRIDEAANYWTNSLQPYMKNYDLMQNPVGNQVIVAGDTFRAGVKPVLDGINMNGNLHALNSSTVVNNSAAIAFWGIQKINIKGRAFASPALNCAAQPVAGQVAPCVFSPGTDPEGNASGAGDIYYVYDFVNTVWAFGKRMIVSRTDSSAKSVPTGTAIDPAYVAWEGKLLDPFAGVSATGVPLSLWPCDSTFVNQGPVNYWCYFRPDRTQ